MKTKTVRDLHNYVVVILFVIILILFTLLSPQFRTTRNILSMLRQTAPIGIMAVGATFVILSGGIDLSVGSILALSGMICARLLRQFGLDAYTAIALSLLAGAGMGYLNGKFVSQLGIPPFIVTFGTMGIFRGFVFLLAFRELGFIKNVPITNETFLAIGGGRTGPVYNLIIFFMVVTVVGYFYLTKSKFGTYVYAVGSNEQSAAMSGINVPRVKTGVFILSGICSALAGILWTSRLMTTTTETGAGNELDVIAAIVVGGTSIMGGRGGIGKTVVGALFIGTLTNGLSMLGVAAYYQPLTKALLIVVAASLDSYLFAKYQEQSKWRLLSGNSDQGLHVGKRERLTIDRAQVLLEIRDVSKSFGEITVLKNVSLSIAKGEVHALVGENGAGKSTLIKIITGVYHKTHGEIRLNGQPVEITNPHHAQSLGISTVFQEFSLIPSLNVARNIMLGREPESRLPGFIHQRKLTAQAQAVLERLKFRLPLNELSERLSVGNNQEVEIAKALSQEAALIIMDEPTASLSAEEKMKLFETIANLSARGVSILFISHILDEVLEIAHTVTVLRNGEVVNTAPAAELDKQKIVRYMVGRELAEQQLLTTTIGEPILEVEQLSREGSFAGVSFTLHKGEILGVTGLVGAGRSEVARALFGLDSFDRGQIRLNGKPVRLTTPEMAMQHGLAFLSEDRKTEGLVLIHSMLHNISMANLAQISFHSILNRNAEFTMAQTYVSRMDIRPPLLDLPAASLSGGNQQKVVLSKWLCRNPAILIVDEPTVGIDIGAKHEIYQVLHDLAGQGVAILLISSDFAEVLRMCPRILTMREGQIVLESDVAREPVTQETLMKAAIGRVD